MVFQRSMELSRPPAVLISRIIGSIRQGASSQPPSRSPWLLTHGLLGLVPAFLAIDLIAIAATTEGFAGDFRMELYPEARAVLRGVNPFPAAEAPFSYHNFIWPIPAAIAVSPFALLAPGAATVVFSCVLGGVLLASLWILGIRDWRVYGLVGVWPATVSGFQAGNITPLLVLLLAIAWRFRGRSLVAGIAIGAAVALKLFLWPMIVWLLATRRWLGSGVAIASGCLVFLTVLPYTSVAEYVRLMAHLAEAFGPQGFSPIGFFAQSGLPSGMAHVLGYSVGLTTLFLACRRQSFVLALAASLLISPIVWLHYFTLLLVPLAIRSKSVGWLWVVPIGMWCCSKATQGSVAWQTAVALGCVAVVIAAAELGVGTSDRALPRPVVA